MGISIWQLLIVLAIVLVLFGAKRMRGLGSDLGGAIKGFKQAMNDDSSNVETSISPVPLKSTTERGKTNGV
ncbi:MAG TPA: twin-arginine translocase TatA/TatE family subunit [Gammaproteobacteria bacterium]|nr:twin-arginine translocase TatA/TatE family subunit [Gammaproteobacteria bacterium]